MASCLCRCCHKAQKDPGQRRAPPAERQQRPGAAAASRWAGSGWAPSAGPGAAGLGLAWPGRAGCTLRLAPHSCLLSGSLNVGAAGSASASPGSAPGGVRTAPAAGCDSAAHPTEKRVRGCVKALSGVKHCQLVSRSVGSRYTSRVTWCELCRWTRGKRGLCREAGSALSHRPSLGFGEQPGIWGAAWVAHVVLGWA